MLGLLIDWFVGLYWFLFVLFAFVLDFGFGCCLYLGNNVASFFYFCLIVLLPLYVVVWIVWRLICCLRILVLVCYWCLWKVRLFRLFVLVGC